MTTWYSRDDAAERAGSRGSVPQPTRRTRHPDSRRAGSVLGRRRSTGTHGHVARACRDPARRGGGRRCERGAVSLDFLDSPAYERFAALSGETFGQVSERTGIPFELLDGDPRVDRHGRSPRPTTVCARTRPRSCRSSSCSSKPRVSATPRSSACSGSQGDSTRRIAEQEAAWWRSEVIEPALGGGRVDASAIANPEFAEQHHTDVGADDAGHVSRATGAFLDGKHHRRLRASSWRRPGSTAALERQPAICFLDISGYTRLTQELGDDAAAELASTVARLVQRTSVQHGGKPIKWLGDGVMFHFEDPGPGVRAALEMVERVGDRGTSAGARRLACGPGALPTG